MAERKTMKVADICLPHAYEVILHLDCNCNQFWLYSRDRAINKHGYSYVSRKLVAKYADMRSCLAHIMDECYNH